MARLRALLFMLLAGWSPAPSPKPAQPRPVSHFNLLLDQCPAEGGGSDAAKRYQRECDQNNADACDQAYVVYECGQGVAKDRARAIQFLERACQLGESCDILGMYYVYNATHPEPARGAALLKRECEEKKSRPACVSLAVLFDRGDGVARDVVRARELYDRACSTGDTEACANLGFSYVKSAPKNVGRGFALTRQACDAGQLMACSNLGLWLMTGSDGVAADTQQGARLLERACTGNQSPACANLGVFYYLGRGVAIDEERGIGLQEKACNLNNAQACESIGNIYASRHDPRAHHFYERACAGGRSDACERARR